MPRYFFDIADGVLTLDDIGIEFPDAATARDAAIKTLPNLAQDEIGLGRSRDIVVLMRDETGRAMFTAALALTAKWLVEIDAAPPADVGTSDASRPV